MKFTTILHLRNSLVATLSVTGLLLFGLASAKADSGVTGQLYFAHSCYYDDAILQWVFPDAAPVRGYLQIAALRDGQLEDLGLMKTEKDGTFSVSLPPGHYVLGGFVAQSNQHFAAEAIVTENAVVTVELYCALKPKFKKP